MHVVSKFHKITRMQCFFKTFQQIKVAEKRQTEICHFRFLLEGRQFQLWTDHKPLCSALNRVSVPWSARQQRHLSYIAEFTSDLCYVSGESNTVADALSRPTNSLIPVSLVSTPPTVNFQVLAEKQTTCPSVQDLSSSPSLRLSQESCEGVSLLCDVSVGTPRPLVPLDCRRDIFNAIHNLAHPGVRATRRLISAHFVWRGLGKDVNLWTRSCLDFQRGKVYRHAKAEVLPIPVPSRRFSHIYVDLVGPLPSSWGYTHLFTIIDRTTRWPEAIPLSSTSSSDCARALFSSWTTIYFFLMVPTLHSPRHRTRSHYFLSPSGKRLSGLFQLSAKGRLSLTACSSRLVSPPSLGASWPSNSSQRSYPSVFSRICVRNNAHGSRRISWRSRTSARRFPPSPSLGPGSTASNSCSQQHPYPKFRAKQPKTRQVRLHSTRCLSTPSHAIITRTLPRHRTLPQDLPPENGRQRRSGIRGPTLSSMFRRRSTRKDPTPVVASPSMRRPRGRPRKLPKTAPASIQKRRVGRPRKKACSIISRLIWFLSLGGSMWRPSSGHPWTRAICGFDITFHGSSKYCQLLM